MRARSRESTRVVIHQLRAVADGLDGDGRTIINQHDRTEAMARAAICWAAATRLEELALMVEKLAPLEQLLRATEEERS